MRAYKEDKPWPRAVGLFAREGRSSGGARQKISFSFGSLTPPNFNFVALATERGGCQALFNSALATLNCLGPNL